ncbi:MAG: response regulator transcription factor [Opitutaceae bacterium]|nr:response regulator transcription factor [Opitutaceae bacterium]
MCADKIPSGPVTVFHIEDDPFCSDVIARLLSKWPEILYLGSAASGREGLAQCRKMRPQIVLLDLGLPDGDGLRLAHELRWIDHPPRLLVFSARHDEATLARLRPSGVAGLIWKAPDVAHALRRAFAALAAGREFFPPDVLAALRQFTSSPNAFFKILSNRELNLIPLLGEGLSDAQIAEKIGVGEATVHSHRQSILRKLSLHRTPDLMRWALEKDFVSRGEPIARENLHGESLSSRDIQLNC